MTLAEAVRRLLEDAAGQGLCDSCLAVACSTSPREMHQVTEELVNDASFQRGSACHNCGRTVPTIMYSVKKCAHCSHAVRPGDDGLEIGADLFHALCFRVITSDEKIRLSRKLTLESRRLIEDARRQMREQRKRWDTEPSAD